MPSILLDGVDLTFRVRQQRQITIKEYLLRGMFRSARNPRYEVNALRNVSVEVGDGERVGIIGANGSGKSTLLRLLAGVYHPTKGTCRVQGATSSLFDLTIGFEMEANGWSNIRYRGYLQGESIASVGKKAPEIAAFSGIGEFLNIPLRYYSSGMLVRLAFSAATAIEPEILLIDEILAAGDHSFQQKAHERIGNLMKKARILVLVSHDLHLLPTLCDRLLWLDKGEVRGDGRPQKVIDRYLEETDGKRKAAA